MPAHVLFLDPDVILDAARVVDSWSTTALSSGGDPAREVFVNAIDPVAIARLNLVLDAVPDMTIVIASHWRLLWPVGTIAEMLHQAGYRGTRFAAVRCERDKPSTTHLSGWLSTVGELLGVAGYAIWADECPTDHLGHLAVGVPRTIQLLKGEVS
jgi:hypothetical protein